MTATDRDIFAIEEYGDSLTQCGRFWGDNPDMMAQLTHIGDQDWFETRVPGVIGLNGNHPGKGPGLLLRNVGNQDVGMVWTAGLRGCMGLAIMGRDEEGNLDTFFTHARHYDAVDATTDATNPMSLAKQFVDTHKDIRVFWGTDFAYGDDPRMGPLKRQHAQQLLSKELGCWVRDSDCVPFHEMTFLPKLGIAYYGKPDEAYKWVKREEHKGTLVGRCEFSMSKGLDKFNPDKDIVGRIQLHLDKLKMDRASRLRLYHQDGKRDNKIRALTQVLEAYKVGNFDVLRHYANAARTNSSPYVDESAKNTWDATGESQTAKLVITAFDDALEKIRAMNETSCGLRADGQNVFDHEEHQRVVSEIASGERESLH